MERDAEEEALLSCAEEATGREEKRKKTLSSHFENKVNFANKVEIARLKAEFQSHESSFIFKIKTEMWWGFFKVKYKNKLSRKDHPSILHYLARR